MKKSISFVLALALILCMIPTAFAADGEATGAADALHALGLFQGTGTDTNGKPIYDLDRAPTRAEAVTMLVRLLGKEDEAKAGTWATPFTDVPNWAKPYVGYAYANKLTSGTSASTFGGSSSITATQYITLVLRALGYESGTDFQWDKATVLSDQIGLTNAEYKNSSLAFHRGDIACISFNSLGSKSKDTEKTLFNKLKEEEVIPVDAILDVDALTAANEGAFIDADVDPNEYYSYSNVGYIDDFFSVDGFSLNHIKVAATDDGYCFKVSYKATKSTKGNLFIMGKQENDGKPEGYTFAIDSKKDAAYIRVSPEFLKDNYHLVMRIENPNGTYNDKNNITLSSSFDTASSPYRLIDYVDDTSTADGFSLYSLEVAESKTGYCFRMQYKSTYARIVNFFVAGTQDGTNEAFSFPLQKGEGYVYRTVSKTFVENNKLLAMRVRNGDSYGEHNTIRIETNLGAVAEDYSKLTYDIGLGHALMVDEVKGFRLNGLSASKTEDGYVIRIQYNSDTAKGVTLAPAGLNGDGAAQFAMLGRGGGDKYLKVPKGFIEQEPSLVMSVKDIEGSGGVRNFYVVYPSAGDVANLSYSKLTYENRAAGAEQFALSDLSVAQTNGGYIIRIQYDSGFSRIASLFPAGAQGQGMSYVTGLERGSTYQYIRIPKSLFENENLLIMRIHGQDDGGGSNFVYIYPNGK